jgi:hypothetical protein
MWSGQRWLINIAIGVLLLGLALRFLPERRGDDSSEAEEDQPSG